jgi:hypothetical protein
MKFLFSSFIFVGLFSATIAHADISVLIFDNEGAADRIINTGHSAYALWDICADTPTKLRLCTDTDKERGVVLNKLPKISDEKYNWIATPITEFLYGTSSKDAAPIIANKEISDAEDKKRYDDYYSQSIASSADKGRWVNSVGALYVRTVYEYRLPGFYDDEVAIMNGLNDAPNKSNYDIFLHNCADFSAAALKPLFNDENLSHSIDGFGLHSPKAIAMNLTKLALEHPDLKMVVIKHPQISGNYPRSTTIMAPSENLYKNPMIIPFFLPLMPAALIVNKTHSFNQESSFKKSLTPEDQISTYGTPEEWKYYKTEFHGLVAKAKDDASLPLELRTVIANAKNDKDVSEKLINYFAQHGLYSINGDDIEMKLQIEGEAEPRVVGMTRETVSAQDKQIGYLVMLASLGQALYENARVRISMEDFKTDWAHLQSLGVDNARKPASTDLSEPTSIGISDDLYDKLFPYYAMQCAVSQLNKVDGDVGGKYGHGLMYLKGACRDKSAAYPRLKLCDENSPSSGAVVSLDASFTNTLFSTLDGKDLLFDAGLKKEEVLNQAFFDETVRKVVKTGATIGVKIDASRFHKTDPNMSDEEFVARQTTNTDWAVSFARDSACTRMPVNKAQISAMIDSLNQRNEEYTTGKVEFSWDEFSNNCVTLMHNALAQAGIRKPISTKSPSLFGKIGKALKDDLPIPGLDTVKLTEYANDISKIDSAEKVFADEDLRKIFNNFETLPLGAAVQWIPMHATNNELYLKGDFKFDAVGDKDWKKFQDYLNDADYSTVEGNLNRVLDRLQAVQKNRTAPATTDTSDLAKFSVKYNAWIDRSITEIQSKLDQIKLAKPVAGAVADSK